MEMAVHDLLKQEVFDLVLFHGREALPILDKVEVPIVVDCGDTNCTRILLQMHRARLWLRPRLFFYYLRARRLEERLARKTPYRFVEAHCSWSRSAEKLEELCIAAAGLASGSYRPESIATHGLSQIEIP